MPSAVSVRVSLGLVGLGLGSFRPCCHLTWNVSRYIGLCVCDVWEHLRKRLIFAKFSYTLLYSKLLNMGSRMIWHRDEYSNWPTRGSTGARHIWCLHFPCFFVLVDHRSCKVENHDGLHRPILVVVATLISVCDRMVCTPENRKRPRTIAGYRRRDCSKPQETTGQLNIKLQGHLLSTL